MIYSILYKYVSNAYIYTYRNENCGMYGGICIPVRNVVVYNIFHIFSFEHTNNKIDITFYQQIKVTRINNLTWINASTGYQNISQIPPF